MLVLYYSIPKFSFCLLFNQSIQNQYPFYLLAPHLYCITSYVMIEGMVYKAYLIIFSFANPLVFHVLFQLMLYFLLIIINTHIKYQHVNQIRISGLYLYILIRFKIYTFSLVNIQVVCVPMPKTLSKKSNESNNIFKMM